MEKIPVLRTMTFTQLLNDLRERGMPIGQDKLRKAIQKGIFPFVDIIDMAQGEYLIYRKGFEEWAAEHSVMETPI